MMENITGVCNSSGFQRYHLRRVGPPATKDGVANIMDFHKVTYMIGRSNRVDYMIDSSDYVQSAMISRQHARLVRKSTNNHRLFDDSLNGLFVNNIKISGSVVLQEGDFVTFGHPGGVRVKPDDRVRQPNSEYQFIFEKCTCSGNPNVTRMQDFTSRTHVQLSLQNAGLTDKVADTESTFFHSTGAPTCTNQVCTAEKRMTCFDNELESLRKPSLPQTNKERKHHRTPTKTFSQEDVRNRSYFAGFSRQKPEQQMNVNMSSMPGPSVPRQQISMATSPTEQQTPNTCVHTAALIDRKTNFIPNNILSNNQDSQDSPDEQLMDLYVDIDGEQELEVDPGVNFIKSKCSSMQRSDERGKETTVSSLRDTVSEQESSTAQTDKTVSPFHPQSKPTDSDDSDLNYETAFSFPNSPDASQISPCCVQQRDCLANVSCEVTSMANAKTAHKRFEVSETSTKDIADSSEKSVENIVKLKEREPNLVECCKTVNLVTINTGEIDQSMEVCVEHETNANFNIRTQYGDHCYSRPWNSREKSGKISDVKYSINSNQLSNTADTEQKSVPCIRSDNKKRVESSVHCSRGLSFNNSGRCHILQEKNSDNTEMVLQGENMSEPCNVNAFNRKSVSCANTLKIVLENVSNLQTENCSEARRNQARAIKDGSLPTNTGPMDACDIESENVSQKELETNTCFKKINVSVRGEGVCDSAEIKIEYSALSLRENAMTENEFTRMEEPMSIGKAVKMPEVAMVVMENLTQQQNVVRLENEITDNVSDILSSDKNYSEGIGSLNTKKMFEFQHFDVNVSEVDVTINDSSTLCSVDRQQNISDTESNIAHSKTDYAANPNHCVLQENQNPQSTCCQLELNESVHLTVSNNNEQRNDQAHLDTCTELVHSDTVSGKSIKSNICLPTAVIVSPKQIPHLEVERFEFERLHMISESEFAATNNDCFLSDSVDYQAEFSSANDSSDASDTEFELRRPDDTVLAECVHADGEDGNAYISTSKQHPDDQCHVTEKYIESTCRKSQTNQDDSPEKNISKVVPGNFLENKSVGDNELHSFSSNKLSPLMDHVSADEKQPFVKKHSQIVSQDEQCCNGVIVAEECTLTCEPDHRNSVEYESTCKPESVESSNVASMKETNDLQNLPNEINGTNCGKSITVPSVTENFKAVENKNVNYNIMADTNDIHDKVSKLSAVVSNCQAEEGVNDGDPKDDCCLDAQICFKENNDSSAFFEEDVDMPCICHFSEQPSSALNSKKLAIDRNQSRKRKLDEDTDDTGSESRTKILHSDQSDVLPKIVTGFFKFRSRFGLMQATKKRTIIRGLVKNFFALQNICESNMEVASDESEGCLLSDKNGSVVTESMQTGFSFVASESSHVGVDQLGDGKINVAQINSLKSCQGTYDDKVKNTANEKQQACVKSQDEDVDNRNETVQSLSDVNNLQVAKFPMNENEVDSGRFLHSSKAAVCNHTSEAFESIQEDDAVNEKTYFRQKGHDVETIGEDIEDDFQELDCERSENEQMDLDVLEVMKSDASSCMQKENKFVKLNVIDSDGQSDENSVSQICRKINEVTGVNTSADEMEIIDIDPECGGSENHADKDEMEIIDDLHHDIDPECGGSENHADKDEMETIDDLHHDIDPECGGSENHADEDEMVKEAKSDDSDLVAVTLSEINSPDSELISVPESDEDIFEGGSEDSFEKERNEHLESNEKNQSDASSCMQKENKFVKLNVIDSDGQTDENSVSEICRKIDEVTGVNTSADEMEIIDIDPECGGSENHADKDEMEIIDDLHHDIDPECGGSENHADKDEMETIDDLHHDIDPECGGSENHADENEMVKEAKSDDSDLVAVTLPEKQNLDSELISVPESDEDIFEGGSEDSFEKERNEHLESNEKNQSDASSCMQKENKFVNLNSIDSDGHSDENSVSEICCKIDEVTSVNTSDDEMEIIDDLYHVDGDSHDIDPECGGSENHADEDEMVKESKSVDNDHVAVTLPEKQNLDIELISVPESDEDIFEGGSEDSFEKERNEHLESNEKNQSDASSCMQKENKFVKLNSIDSDGQSDENSVSEICCKIDEVTSVNTSDDDMEIIDDLYHVDGNSHNIDPECGGSGNHADEDEMVKESKSIDNDPVAVTLPEKQNLDSELISVPESDEDIFEGGSEDSFEKERNEHLESNEKNRSDASSCMQKENKFVKLNSIDSDGQSDENSVSEICCKIDEVTSVNTSDDDMEIIDDLYHVDGNSHNIDPECGGSENHADEDEMVKESKSVDNDLVAVTLPEKQNLDSELISVSVPESDEDIFEGGSEDSFEKERTEHLESNEKNRSDASSCMQKENKFVKLNSIDSDGHSDENSVSEICCKIDEVTSVYTSDDEMEIIDDLYHVDGNSHNIDPECGGSENHADEDEMVKESKSVDNDLVAVTLPEKQNLDSELIPESDEDIFEGGSEDSFEKERNEHLESNEKNQSDAYSCMQKENKFVKLNSIDSDGHSDENSVSEICCKIDEVTSVNTSDDEMEIIDDLYHVDGNSHDIDPECGGSGNHADEDEMVKESKSVDNDPVAVTLPEKQNLDSELIPESIEDIFEDGSEDSISKREDKVEKNIESDEDDDVKALRPLSLPVYTIQESTLSPVIPNVASVGRAESLTSNSECLSVDDIDLLSCTFDDTDYSLPSFDLSNSESNDLFVPSSSHSKRSSEESESVDGEVSFKMLKFPLNNLETSEKSEHILSYEQCKNLEATENSQPAFSTGFVPHSSAEPTVSQFTQVGNSSSKEKSKLKAKELFARLKAKRELFLLKAEPKEELKETPCEEMQSLVPAEQRSLFQIQTDFDNVNSYFKRCKEVVDSLKKTLNKQPALDSNPRIQTWRQDLVKLEEKLNLPQTVVAVVGNTGAGKSSLMNAILEQADVLPTSGMQACTAVVVEIVSNNKNHNYEADIQFLSRKEWFDELQLLLAELTGPDGKVRKRQRDPSTEAGIAFSKIKSVYGLVDSIEVLGRINSVTKWLDCTKQISTTCPKELRKEIDCYIKTSVDRTEGQYWPIIKQVKIRLPNCDACSSGAVLVDLPGTRDSNAARDKIAKEYLKTCTAVWVVADINRAVDEKTAKDLLGENFRRQLLMDGQYGNIGFVCTKTDILTPSEIIGSLKLDAETIPFEDEIMTLEEDRCETKSDITKTNKEIQQLHKDLMAAEKNCQEFRDDLTEATQLLDPADLDSQDQEKQALDELQAAVATQEASITDLKTKHQKKEQSKAELEKKLAEIEGKITVKRKTLNAICAKARSEYSKKQLKRDFKAGLREMRSNAGPLDEENDMEDDDDDYDQDGDDEEIKSTADNLRVFCVSAAEYQKMKNLRPTDGQPTVFSTVEDTQIPALRSFIHEMTSVRRKTATEQLIRRIGNFVFDIENYILDEGTECLEIRSFAKSTIKTETASLEKRLKSVRVNFTDDVRMLIKEEITPKLKDGQASAAENANEICARWGAERNIENRQLGGGLPWSTYKATVARDGFYNSPSFGPVDFNEQLAEPIYRNISISWDKVFSDLLWNKLETYKSQVIGIFSLSCGEICNQLQACGVAQTRTARVRIQLISSGKNNLTEMITSLKDHVTNRQREISRVLTPAIQKELEETYKSCACQTGKGTFIKMKNIMAPAVDKKRSCMFKKASQSLLQELDSLEMSRFHKAAPNAHPHKTPCPLPSEVMWH